LPWLNIYTLIDKTSIIQELKLDMHRSLGYKSAVEYGLALPT
jgi:hypothetical protein